MTPRVAIIGAGPSGMAQLRAFESAARAGHEIPDIVCFEKQADWGGQWNLTWRTGLDEHGEPVHSSMYRNLWSNGPKEALEFAEYTFDDHFGRPISSYPPRAVLWDYINGRAENSGVKKYVRFSTVVRWVEFDEQTRQFTVTVEDLESRETTSETFDHVIVGSGHFSTPHVPYFTGIETFPGRLSHAHDFRGAEGLADQDVLLIGASYSAEDIGVQAFKMGARSVTFSYRTAPMGFPWPEGMEELPLVERFEGSIAHFANGESRRFDAVVLCTGYLHHYPFLPSDLALDSPNCLYPDHLYRGVVSEANDRLFYLGAQDQWFTFNMFDAQAWYVRDVIMGRIALPDAAEQRRDIDAWRERFASLQTAGDEIRFQADYIRDLIDLTDYPSFDLDRVVEIFLAWKADKQDDVLTYRDKVYPSVLTGTMASVHHTPWLQELDDSLERYLSDPVDDEVATLVTEEEDRAATT
ncbi:NAD(P)-binding domain-containing protein [Aeromicrobium duanguangcaii]|uniref:NAD(P)/FAD-dependent oxidoreductase n=1 Tax=Aeromicrobium duanguangcaii TaxID=2968086 RepID=A0ABY5KJ39_9ACTN|nr:NAD(P)/FAD-dependent oxidoreductase [Aeromicrobium duanguangcaii]MCD9153838.1 NAD(P)/FAD-dependent oxidoreductase [Aeromicrobium duanguangcaii]UUI69081.1 NAD(P)/FAD-dependent oxidoreductase [Aeromicrobium duanguangcaii]